MDEIVVSDKEKKKFDFNEWRTSIYAAVFYTCGLVLGSYFYKIAASDTINNMLKPETDALSTLIINNFCMYFSVFMIVVFLGFCMIGFPIINIIPALLGMNTGLKIAYFYTNYAAQGIGYSLIMIVPAYSLFLAVIVLTIEASSNMSKQIFHIAKQDEAAEEMKIKKYLKKFLILGVAVACVALIDSSLSYAFQSIISI